MQEHVYMCSFEERFTNLGRIAILSTGEVVENPKYYVKAQKKLARLQCAHSKKKKGSKNREKARLKVA
jgi:putative transposase